MNNTRILNRELKNQQFVYNDPWERIVLSQFYPYYISINKSFVIINSFNTKIRANVLTNPFNRLTGLALTISSMILLESVCTSNSRTKHTN